MYKLDRNKNLDFYRTYLNDSQIQYPKYWRWGPYFCRTNIKEYVQCIASCIGWGTRPELRINLNQNVGTVTQLKPITHSVEIILDHQAYMPISFKQWGVLTNHLSHLYFCIKSSPKIQKLFQNSMKLSLSNWKRSF